MRCFLNLQIRYLLREHTIIITSTYVIQSRLRVIIISTIAKRVDIGDVGRICNHRTIGIGNRNYIAPSVIVVVGNNRTCAVVNFDVFIFIFSRVVTRHRIFIDYII